MRRAVWELMQELVPLRLKLQLSNGLKLCLSVCWSELLRVQHSRWSANHTMWHSRSSLGCSGRKGHVTNITNGRVKWRVKRRIDRRTRKDVELLKRRTR